MIGPIVQWVNALLFFYYLACNAYLHSACLLAAIRASVSRNQPPTDSLALTGSGVARRSRPISLIVPAHNEERLDCRDLCALCSAWTTRSLKSLSQTTARRTVHSPSSSNNFQSDPKRLLVSASDRNQTRESRLPQSHRAKVDCPGQGGRRRQVRCNQCGYEPGFEALCVLLDADSMLGETDLLRIMAPVVNDPDRVVAAGGIVRVINGLASQEREV